MTINYVRAVDVRNKNAVVYAFFHKYEDELIEPCDDNRFYFGPVWIVWFPETVEYTSLSPEQFNERYILEGNLPDSLRDRVALFPTYKEWVDSTHGRNQPVTN